MYPFAVRYFYYINSLHKCKHIDEFVGSHTVGLPTSNPLQKKFAKEISETEILTPHFSSISVDKYIKLY